MNLKDFSTGVDIEDIERFEKYVSPEDDFVKKVYTENEIKYCYSKKNYARHLAVRFCAKEAVIKAFASLGKDIPDMKAISVERKENGAPFIKMNLEGFEKYEIRISCSHSPKTAVANAVIAERN